MTRHARGRAAPRDTSLARGRENIALLSPELQTAIRLRGTRERGPQRAGRLVPTRPAQSAGTVPAPAPHASEGAGEAHPRAEKRPGQWDGKAARRVPPVIF